MNISIAEIVENVKNNPVTLLVIDISGDVKDCILLKEIPNTPGDLSKLVRSDITGSIAIALINQSKNISENKIKKRIHDAVDSLKYSKTHTLKPGVNIPEKDAKGLKKLWWNFKRRKALLKIQITNFFKNRNE